MPQKAISHIRKATKVKRLTLTIIFACALVLAHCVEFKTAISIRNPKEDNQPADYQVSAEFFKRNTAEIEIEFERENGEQYQNLLIDLQKQWKFIRIAGKRVYNQSADANIYQLDLRVSHVGFTAGIAEVWDLHPSVAFVAGTKYTKQIGLPGVTDFQLDSKSDVISRDFKQWQHESTVTVSGALTSIVSAYVKFREQYYSKFDWQVKVGLSFRLMEKNDD